MTAVIEICKNNRHILPLEKFVNGRVDQAQADELTCRLLGRTEETKLQEKHQKIMVTESPHMTYVGKNYGQSKLQHSQNLMKHYVGVYDKKRGKMKVYDTEIYTMLPKIQGEDKDETDAPVPEKTMKEKADMLTTAFGSSRKRRTLDTSKRHAVDSDMLEGALKSTVDHGVQEAVTYKTKKESEVAAPESATIPPCNKDAKTVEEAYQLSDILSDRDLSDLHNSAKEFFDSTFKKVVEWQKENKYPAHVLKKLEILPISDKERWLRCKCLLYLTFMIQFYQLGQKQLTRADALPETCPASIRQKLLNNFTLPVKDGNKTKRLRPGRMKDRLISYILTLALIVDEYHLAPMDLQKDLKLGSNKMETILKALGCKVVKGKNSESFDYEAVLKVPLVFPKPRVSRK